MHTLPTQFPGPLIFTTLSEFLPVKSGLNEHLESYLDDLLHRDDIPSMPQANRLFWGQTLVALLHHLQKEFIIIIFGPQSKNCTERICYLYCEGYYFGCFPSNLSEVTLFNEDCACKWNHVAALGLVGRKVRHSYLWLKEKRTIAGRLSAESEYTGYYKSSGNSVMSVDLEVVYRPLRSQEG